MKNINLVGFSCLECYGGLKCMAIKYIFSIFSFIINSDDYIQIMRSGFVLKFLYPAGTSKTKTEISFVIFMFHTLIIPVFHISISNYVCVWGFQLWILAILIVYLYVHEYEGKKKNVE